MVFFIRAYDEHDRVVGRQTAETELQAHTAFINLCCSSDRVVEWVRIFSVGDTEPLVWAYRNLRSMHGLILQRSPSELLH